MVIPPQLSIASIGTMRINRQQRFADLLGFFARGRRLNSQRRGGWAAAAVQMN